MRPDVLHNGIENRGQSICLAAPCSRHSIAVLTTIQTSLFDFVPHITDAVPKFSVASRPSSISPWRAVSQPMPATPPRRHLLIAAPRHRHVVGGRIAMSDNCIDQLQCRKFWMLAFAACCSCSAMTTIWHLEIFAYGERSQQIKRKHTTFEAVQVGLGVIILANQPATIFLLAASRSVVRRRYGRNMGDVAVLTTLLVFSSWVSHQHTASRHASSRIRR